MYTTSKSALIQERSGNITTQQTMVQNSFKGLGNLIKLLPSGTFFLFLFVNPILTNNGECNTTNKYLTGALLLVCAFSCCFSWFTDSDIDSKGVAQYGIVTRNGLYVFGTGTKLIDSPKYKLGPGDFVHAFLSLLVFAVVVLLDPNTVECFYPTSKSAQKILFMVLPPVVGTFSSFIFVLFPNRRHGIGYPSSQVSQELQLDYGK